MPDGTTRFSYEGRPIHHYMGCSTFANHTVVPEIALAKVDADAPFQSICYIGCGVTTGVGAVINTAQVETGSSVVVFGLGGIGLNVIQGARLAGADMIVGVDLNPDREEWGRKFGMTHFVNPKDHDDVVAHLVELTRGGADYSFECIGNVNVMRQALECCHKGWGQSIIIGVAPAGAEIATRPFQLVTGSVLARHGVRGRAGAHRCPQDRGLVHVGQDRDRPDDHPHARARGHQPRLRADARGRVDPLRGALLMRWAAMMALLAAPAPALAQDGPRPLTFSSEGESYEVPTDGFESLDYHQDTGLALCLTEPVEREVAAFTEAHVGDVVRVAIGETQVFAVEVVTPYAGGCIDWPVHPMVAANYVAMLTGEAPRMPLPPESTGE